MKKLAISAAVLICLATSAYAEDGICTCPVDLAPTTLDFGSVAVGQTAQLTVVASCGSPLGCDGTAYQRVPSGPFRIVSPTPVYGCSSVGETFPITIEFAPTTAGPFSDSLRVCSLTAASTPVAAVLGTGAPTAVPAVSTLGVVILGLLAATALAILMSRFVRRVNPS